MEERAGGQTIAEVQAELASWVVYSPRALSLLTHVSHVKFNAAIFRQTGLALTVRRYTKHPDAAVSKFACHLIKAWKDRFQQVQAQRALPATREVKRRRVRVDDDDSSAVSNSSSKSSSGEEDNIEIPDSTEADTAPNLDGSPSGWHEEVRAQTRRGRQERFRFFTLRRPFRCTKWNVRVRLAEGQQQLECRELLSQMAVDFGAVAASGEQLSVENQPMLQRLQRLEERFRGSGVTEGEARNAMRLFERELSKANWTEEKFMKLKRQLAGVEEWSVADVIAESSLQWTEPCKRQAWFADACERVAMPLGVEFGYTSNGGCCFVGPLSAVAGAALTSVLVCHFANLDLERARQTRGGSRTSAPQFLQGFVDGALERERHLVWEQLFAIQNEEEAARFCQDNLDRGFFDGTTEEERPGQGPDDDLQSMLRNVFSGRHDAHAPPCQATRRRPPASSQASPPSPPVPTVAGPPENYTPFSGKGQRLTEDGNAATAGGAVGSCCKKPYEGGPDSWALTFASNLELVRSSRRRSREQAHKTYHWTFSGRAVKATQTGTASYAQGLQAGEKRKGQIDGTARSAKRKFCKGSRLAITR